MILDKEKDMKKRMTTQKRIVYNTLDELGHCSVEYLIEYLKANNSSISLATIYRNINSLLDDNMIKYVKLKGVDVLETVKEEHIHFVCDICGNVYDMKVDKQAIMEYSLRNCVHQVKEFDLVLYGVCQECIRKGNVK